LIQDSYEIYTQGAVWLSYSYLLLIVTAVMAMSDLVYTWVFYLMLGVSILVTLIFIFDAEEEIKMKKDSREWLDNDKKYLEKPGELE
jgi:cell division protein FtsW (lipid II flippase)